MISLVSEGLRDRGLTHWHCKKSVIPEGVRCPWTILEYFSPLPGFAFLVIFLFDLTKRPFWDYFVFFSRVLEGKSKFVSTHLRPFTVSLCPMEQCSKQ